MSVVGMLRAQWDARVHASPIWERLAREAEYECLHADLEVDYISPHELYAIAGDLAALADLLELRADLRIGQPA